jgi:RNA polymerase sigma-70 factor (ECF subfamily)
MEDRIIVEWLKKESDKGISALMNHYGGLLVYMAKNIGIIDKEDLEECIGDVLFHVWRKIRRYDEKKSSFKTWLVLLAKGCITDYVRKKRKLLATVPIESILNIEGPKRKEDYLDVLELLQKLPPEYGEVFYRRFVLGESVEHIASVMQLSADNVYKRIQRGREKLKEFMEREES